MSGRNSTQFCSIENPRKVQTSNGVATGSFYAFNSTKSMDKFCKNLGFNRGYAGLSSGCTNITITGGQPIAHYENGTSRTYTNGDAITSNTGCY